MTIDFLVRVFAMVQGFQAKEKYDVRDLLRIMCLLRAPGGCPWDREQTHQSIRKNLIEETYELVEAIDRDDPAMMREELGDVLLQVVFHSCMAEEAGRFTFDDVADEVCKKLIIRHPHVFGDVSITGTEDVLANWDEIKRRTKGQKSTTQAMDSVPRQLPALMRAQKIQSKAAKSEFEFEDIDGALSKIPEEYAELRACVSGGDAQGAAEELGDLIFSAVNVSRFLKADAEEVLTAATDKFAARFSRVEAMAEETGRPMSELSAQELDELWECAKSE